MYYKAAIRQPDGRLTSAWGTVELTPGAVLGVGPTRRGYVMYETAFLAHKALTDILPAAHRRCKVAMLTVEGIGDGRAVGPGRVSFPQMRVIGEVS